MKSVDDAGALLDEVTNIAKTSYLDPYHDLVLETLDKALDERRPISISRFTEALGNRTGKDLSSSTVRDWMLKHFRDRIQALRDAELLKIRL